MDSYIDAEGYPLPVEKCPFCPANGKVTMLAETGLSYAVMALNPPVPGCILLIPKHHVESYLELLSTWHAEKVELIKLLEASGIIEDHRDYTPSCNLREPARTVDHFHDWLVPRMDDTPKDESYGRGTASLVAYARSMRNP